ncbi:MAG: translation initiation factor eIF-1A [Candidatus Anstonellales archaeon]
MSKEDEEINIQEEIKRTRIPKGKEVIGKVIGMLGAARMRVDCQDGNERVCRIPGKVKRKIWVRDGDYVIVEPWEINGDKNGDIIWRYSKIQVDYLKQKGMIKI